MKGALNRGKNKHRRKSKCNSVEATGHGEELSRTGSQQTWGRLRKMQEWVLRYNAAFAEINQTN